MTFLHFPNLLPYFWNIIQIYCHIFGIGINDGIIGYEKSSHKIDLQELHRVLEAGLEPAQPLLAKGF